MKKIPVKTLYLLLVIGIGLIGLGIGSTYAIFTSSAEISNPISLNSNLTHTSDIIETIEVEVPAGKFLSSTLNVTNSSGTTLNYTVWYLDEGKNIEICSSGTVSGSLNNGSNSSIIVDIRNNSSATVTVILGVASNKESIVLGDGMKSLPSGELSSVSLISYLTDLYKYNYDSSKSVAFGDGTGMNYYAPKVNLMNDGLDSSGNMTNDHYAGNIRYYGAEPDNYIYFNCDNYDNQSDSTCEKWRIVGIVDGKVKIVRNDPIGVYSWDYDYNNDLSSTSYSNDWSTASLRTLLNESYYGNLDTIYYNGYPSTAAANANFKTNGIGIKDNQTKMMISESTWYANRAGDQYVYANYIYKTERTGSNNVTNNISLLYPSDYGYAADLKACNVNMNSYNESACVDSNWMMDLMYHDDGNTNWLITGYSENTYRAFYVVSSGSFGWESLPTGPYYIYPTVYLDTGISINNKGDGTEGKPYQIDIEESFLHVPYGATYYVGVTSTTSGNYTGATATYTAGDQFPEMVKVGDVFVYGDYEYRYGFSMWAGSWSQDSSKTGWAVRVLNTGKTSYGKILEEINGKPVTTLDWTFYGCSSLINAPEVPDSVTSMLGTFYQCTSLTTAPVLPDGLYVLNRTFEQCHSLNNYVGNTNAVGDFSNYVIPNGVYDMTLAFRDCPLLVSAPMIPDSVLQLYHTFDICTGLTGRIIINANPINYENCFYGTTKDIWITGNSSVKSEIATTGNNGNVKVS